jgi:hypothetical protein
MVSIMCAKADAWESAMTVPGKGGWSQEYRPTGSSSDPEGLSKAGSMDSNKDI